jgi:hypothetical protein
MNTRGLTELVILQVGKSLGVLDDTMFTLLVLMAVITTVMTAPLLQLAYPPRLLERDIAEAEADSLGLSDAYTVMVISDRRAGDPDLVRLAAGLIGREQPARVVLVQLLTRTRTKLEVASGLGVELAQLATAADELRALARVGQALGIDCSVQAQLSDDPRGDVVTLAARAGADVVVVYDDWVGSADVWPVTQPFTLVEVPEVSAAAAGAVRSVGVILDGGDDARAALRMAAQLSIANGAALSVSVVGSGRSSRRAAAIVDILRRAGVNSAAAVEAGTLGGVGMVLFAAASASPVSADAGGTSTLRVHAGAADTDRDFEEIAARISVGEPDSV